MLAPAGIVTVPVEVGLARGAEVESAVLVVMEVLAAVAEVSRPRVEKDLFFQRPDEVS